MKKIALITGASGGIGYEMAMLFARTGTDVCLVARNEQKLRTLKQSFEKDFAIRAHCVSADLSTPEGILEVTRYVELNRLRVEYLVNNAGFGDYGNFIERSMEKYSEMLNLNINALTALCHYFACRMVEQGRGRILNVASLAGFQPDPYFAVYGATKAFVINFSEALHKELENTGVTVTVLSPGATQTNFMERADMAESKLYDNQVMTASEVARVGFEGMMKGRLHVIPGLRNKVLGFISDITPSGKLRLAIAARIMRKK